MRFLLPAALLPVLLTSAQTQFLDHGFRERTPSSLNFTAQPLSGAIRGVPPGQLSELRVELVDMHSRVTRADSLVSTNGLFSFGSVPLGNYELRVTNLMGAVVHAREIHSSAPGPIEIHLSTAYTPSLPPISIHRLQHKVPKAAAKKLREAERFHHQGNPSAARVSLAEAIAIDPTYFEALANLGALELADNQPAPAIGHLSRALELDPAAHLVAANLSAAHMLEQHYAEAEEFARQSLRFMPSFGRSRYLLALSLLKQNKNVPEALGQLEKAKADFAPAGALLDQLRR